MAKICYLPVNSIDKATDVKVDITSEKFKMNNEISTNIEVLNKLSRMYCVLKIKFNTKIKNSSSSNSNLLEFHFFIKMSN